MKTEYNSESFTEEEVKKGLHLKLIKTLLELDAESPRNGDFAGYRDIHIYNGDCGIIVVEWCFRYFNEPSGEFKYVGENERIMQEVELPDNTMTYAQSDEEAEEILNDWLAENPGWKKNEWGHWYNEAENEAFKKLVEEAKRINETNK